jgi:ribosomal protein S18 acetylase RimI-like enzyme
MLGASSQVSIRKARLADARPLAQVFSESWRHAYRGIIPHLHLDTMIRRRGSEWWANAIRSGESILVLDVAGSVGGYATSGVARTRGHGDGEVYELYLATTYQGIGLGEHLFEACRHRLEMRRLNGLIVWALVDNTPAIDFYWRRGGRPVARIYDRIGGAKLEKIALSWP